jgi:hypothetical protein
MENFTAHLMGKQSGLRIRARNESKNLDSGPVRFDSFFIQFGSIRPTFLKSRTGSIRFDLLFYKSIRFDSIRFTFQKVQFDSIRLICKKILRRGIFLLYHLAINKCCIVRAHQFPTKTLNCRTPFLRLSLSSFYLPNF